MGVQDPLYLAHHLEVLGGTAALVDVISSKQRDTSLVTQECDGLTDDTLR